MKRSDPPGDLPADEFRRAAHEVADLMADYLEQVGGYPVVPKISPGEVRAALPASPPETAEPMERILDDYRSLIEPNVTHWNHPGFFGYFSITGSGPGVLGEALAAALNVNAMLWKTGPAPTELEELVCDWLRQMVGLPEGFVGHINDTASISTLLALAAARHRLPGLDILNRGLAGRDDCPPLVVYTSQEAHVSVDKAAMTLGLGLEQVRRIGVDAEFRLDPSALARAIQEDRDAGRLPVAVVATVGTTSTTSVDPVGPIADICAREKMWLHVDAAYAGAAALCAEYRAALDGAGRADSVVINPHKWLFTPVDCSVMLLRRPETLKAAFNIIPEYLRTPETGVTNLMEYGVQLGRRFRALKLWMVIRAFGVEGLRARIREHCRLAAGFAGRVKADPRFELCAPVPFSTVCFRATPEAPPEEQDDFNERLLQSLNDRGPVFLSQTRLRERFVLRLSVGNLRTQESHMETVWKLLDETVSRLEAAGGS